MVPGLGAKRSKDKNRRVKRANDKSTLENNQKSLHWKWDQLIAEIDTQAEAAFSKRYVDHANVRFYATNFTNNVGTARALILAHKKLGCGTRYRDTADYRGFMTYLTEYGDVSWTTGYCPPEWLEQELKYWKRRTRQLRKVAAAAQPQPATT